MAGSLPARGAAADHSISPRFQLKPQADVIDITNGAIDDEAIDLPIGINYRAAPQLAMPLAAMPALVSPLVDPADRPGSGASSEGAASKRACDEFVVETNIAFSPTAQSAPHFHLSDISAILHVCIC